MKPFSVREIKKAKTKLACLEAILALGSERAFREIRSLDIAKHAGITEMTLFNYFATKEELLVYFMRVWNLEEMAVNMEEPLYGAMAIRRIYQRTAMKINERPTIMLSLIGFIASMSTIPKFVPVEPAERWILFPDLPELRTMDIPGLTETLKGHVEEMEVEEGGASRMVDHLINLFYGGALNAHMSGKDISKIYQEGLDLILGNCGKQ